jgi:hypothetical protein
LSENGDSGREPVARPIEDENEQRRGERCQRDPTDVDDERRNHSKIRVSESLRLSGDWSARSGGCESSKSSFELVELVDIGGAIVAINGDN